ncbi:MAG: hypothetical protein ACHQ03_06455 [Candidatus Bathyarchaeia archaeon]
MKIVAMFNLKENVNLEDYRKWSSEVDQKTTPNQPGYRRFDVYEVNGILQGSKPPYQYSGSKVPYQIVEWIEVESQEALERSQNSPEMSNVMKEWLEFVDQSSVVILRVEQIK